MEKNEEVEEPLDHQTENTNLIKNNANCINLPVKRKKSKKYTVNFTVESISSPYAHNTI